MPNYPLNNYCCPQLTRLTLYDNKIHFIHSDAFEGVQKWALPFLRSANTSSLSLSPLILIETNSTPLKNCSPCLTLCSKFLARPPSSTKLDQWSLCTLGQGGGSQYILLYWRLHLQSIYNRKVLFVCNVFAYLWFQVGFHGYSWFQVGNS